VKFAVPVALELSGGTSLAPLRVAVYVDVVGVTVLLLDLLQETSAIMPSKKREEI
jgi:hypothetical protein